MMTKEWLLAFSSTHHAIAAEKTLTNEGFSVAIIPTPRGISASCGLSLLWKGEEKPDCEGILQSLVKKQIQWADLYIRFNRKHSQSRWRQIKTGR